MKTRSTTAHLLVATAVLLAGTGLFLPILDKSFVTDDFLHLAVLEDHPRVPHRDVLDQFRLVPPRDVLADPWQGDSIPWWFDDTLKMHMFRPISCLLHMADFAVHGKQARGFQRTSLMVWGLLLLLVLMLYRRLAALSGRGPWVVLAAGLFFALDDAHIITVSWLANRYAVVTLLFVVGAVLTHHAWRSHGSRWARFASWALFLGALCSSEIGLGVVGWVLAYELCLGQGKPAARLRGVWPFLVMAGAFVVLHVSAGYGVTGGPSGYVDPVAAPGNFLWVAFVERLPRTIMGLLTTLPAQARPEGWSRDEVTLLAWGLTVAGLALLTPHLRRDRTARFMGLGALIAVLPALPAGEHDRALMQASIGSCWVLGSFVVDSLARLRPDREGARTFSAGHAAWGLVALAVVGVHGVTAPRQVRVALDTPTHFEKSRYGALNAPMPEHGHVKRSRVLLLRADSLDSLYFGITRAGFDHIWPKAIWPLSGQSGPQRLVRTGPRSFRLESRVGLMNRSFRRTPPAVGEVFEEGLLTVTIERVNDRQVLALSVETDLPLDHPDIWLLSHDGTGWQRVTAPAIGESVQL